MNHDFINLFKNTPYFLDNWYFHLNNYPNAIALYDELLNKELSFLDIEKLSGKVFLYLKQNDINKEDIVVICLPRNYQAVACMIGVWKCGAAFTIIEDNQPKNRILNIKNDTNCKLLIDSNLLKTINKNPYKKGYIKANIHDAAFVVYTSGSTGSPKGCIHEYGNILIDKMSGKSDRISQKTNYALISPLSFITSIKIILVMIDCGSKLHLISYKTTKNIVKLKKFFYERKINATFLPPSMLKIMDKNFGPSMKYIFTGSEAANGIFVKDAKLINTYSMSECAFSVTQFEIDKPYDICPVGKPNLDFIQVRIKDSNENDVVDGEVGEITFNNPFMRGYVNLPEETKNAFRGGVFHSGDLGKILPDGNLVYIGRINDTIKINGIRIEPIEIEKQINKYPDIKECIIKCFKQNSSNILVCYYLIDKGCKNLNINHLNNFLFDSLPNYMIPNFWVKVHAFPIKENGKIDKVKLKKPNFDKLLENIPPEGFMETKFYEVAKRFLPEINFGVTDNLLSIGMNSLKAAQFVSIINDYDSRVGTSDVLRYKNIRDIINAPKEIGWFFSDYVSSKPIIVLSSGIIPVSGLSFVCNVWNKYFNVFIIEPFTNHIEWLIQKFDFQILINAYIEYLEKNLPDCNNIWGFAGFSFGGLISISLAKTWHNKYGKYKDVIMGDTIIKPINKNIKIPHVKEDDQLIKIINLEQNNYEDSEIATESTNMTLKNLNAIIDLLNTTQNNEKYEGNVIFLSAKKDYDDKANKFKIAFASSLFKNLKLYEFPDCCHNDLYLNKKMNEFYNKLFTEKLNIK